jgi:hypothetical protein
MSLVASYFAPVQNNPFGFLNRESFKSVGSTLYSTSGKIDAESGTKKKSDALMSNAACFMMFDSRGLSVYRDDTLLYAVPGINTIQVKAEGNPTNHYVSINGGGWLRELLDPVQKSASWYYAAQGDGLTLTSYGDLIMQDYKLFNETKNGTKLFQTKHFSLARYYLAITKKLINVSQYDSNRDEVPTGASIVSWDASKGNFTKQSKAMSFGAQSGNRIWALVKITSDDKLQAMTSDDNDNITAIQWDYNELFNITPRTTKVTSLAVKDDGLYINNARVNKKALSGVKTMYFCLDGDLILCDTYDSMLWSLYVEAATKVASTPDYVPDYDVNKVYTQYVINAVHDYRDYLLEFDKAKANYTLVDSSYGILKGTRFAMNSLSVINTSGSDTYFKTLDKAIGSLISGSVTSVYEKLMKSNNNDSKFGDVTGPVKFLKSKPSSTSATSEGKKLDAEIKKLNAKTKTIKDITTSIVNSYKTPYSLIKIEAGPKTNKNQATLLIKEARLYAGGSVTDYTDVTGLIGAWASVVIINADYLTNGEFLKSPTDWTNFIQAINSKPSSTNTLKITYELNGKKSTISAANGPINFGSGINVDCKIDWGKCVNGSQKYEIVAEPFGTGKACPDDLPADKTQKCINTPVNCVGGWGAFSACENGTQMRTYTISTPAEYGGAPCLANGMPNYITQTCTVPKITSNVDTTSSSSSSSSSSSTDDYTPTPEPEDPSFWEKYKWLIAGGGFFCFIIVIIIIFMFVLKKPAPVA